MVHEVERPCIDPGDQQGRSEFVASRLRRPLRLRRSPVISTTRQRTFCRDGAGKGDPCGSSLRRGTEPGATMVVYRGRFLRVQPESA